MPGVMPLTEWTMMRKTSVSEASRRRNKLCPGELVVVDIQLVCQCLTAQICVLCHESCSLKPKSGNVRHFHHTLCA